MRRLAFALIALAASQPALACPACARDGAGPGGVVALGAIILLPFAIAAVVFPVLKRGSAPPR